MFLVRIAQNLTIHGAGFCDFPVSPGKYFESTIKYVTASSFLIILSSSFKITLQVDTIQPEKYFLPGCAVYC
jgi:hypothetical protein